ncbi:uncharacterized protein N7473_007624 [Penicillium subrubescens]|jgi:hypothetical protein|uniref:Uncharacterized protein n=1 Tax=Penicillium subrubescens TaxID=1316194 RepID=A0A1Q5UQR1_9EURO|nr:uncharacterized protein N7473_007624 [Penicillium subrubescens]KAJ5891396.1 hypothetical protein N7473_007624 [Penicillium subrubescens]OKP14815.1 hypothetical protein PENSUB_5879 [Penicillium subrubescens]
MGWFWGDNKSDPVKKLDPGLREFLEQETPDQYVPAPDLKQPAPTPSPAHSSEPQEAGESSKPKVPAASLYQDGRYADLWKTYNPPSNVDSTPGVRGAERVIEQYKEHGDTVQRAAMENCALENEALAFCFQTGNWKKQIESRLTMCSAENATFSRCFQTQTKFLQALGYAAAFDYDPEREERIQMHADTLYHQMLDYEKKVAEAKAAGIEPPPLTSLFNPDKPPRVEGVAGTKVEIPGGEAVPAGFKPSKPLIKLTPHERELEIRTHNAQLEQQKMYVEEATPFIKSQADARTKRQEKAVSWFGETLGKWLS